MAADHSLSSGRFSLPDEAAYFDYRDGTLSWNGGSSAIKDEDIITASKVEGSDDRHTVWSLVPTNPLDVSSQKQAPFELRTISSTKLPQDFLDKHLFQALPTYLDPNENDVEVLISTQ